MNQISVQADSFSFRTFRDPPREAHKQIAIVFDTVEASNEHAGEMEEGHFGYGVMEPLIGVVFKDIEFSFDLSLSRYRNQEYRENFLALLKDTWMTRVIEQNVPAVAQKIKGIEIALNSML